MKRCLLALVFALVVLAPLSATGTATMTHSRQPAGDGAHVYERYTIAWTSTAGGAVSGNPFAVVAGYLTSIRFVPGTGGTQPTDLYDVTLTDGGITDLLAGGGADRSNASSSILSWDPKMFQDGSRTLDVAVANAGNAKTGTVVILVETK